MKMKHICLYLLLCGAAWVQAVADNAMKLWYEQPARLWVEALPLGKGRLTAMVFG